MSVSRSCIERNLEGIRKRISEAAERGGRASRDIRLVAVTKSVGVAEARILYDLGVTDLGENRVEQARGKVEAVHSGVVWHMIGTIQRRKAREVTGLFDLVDSVDRLELAESLERRCAELGKVLPVLLEVNVAGEESKHGFDLEEIGSAFERVNDLDHLEVRGLMTMAPYTEDAELSRPLFARLRGSAEELGVTDVSMGMTNDFEVAIEEGATEVRIGRALFKD